MERRIQIKILLKKLIEGEAKPNETSQDFWSLLNEHPDMISEILPELPSQILYELIFSGLKRVDPDMFILAEKNSWLRERVGNLIRSLGKDELERLYDKILESGLDRSSIASRIKYRYRKLTR